MVHHVRFGRRHYIECNCTTCQAVEKLVDHVEMLVCKVPSSTTKTQEGRDIMTRFEILLDQIQVHQAQLEKVI
jgi:hypothetical protein